MRPFRLAVIFALLTLGACKSVVGPQTFHDTVGNTQLTGATADVRFIFAHPKNDADQQHNADGQAAGANQFNVCAEPSPDVAKAISQAVTESAEATLQGLKTLGDSASINAKQGFALQQNSAVAELGRRLATTQLLRDGLYRLCEAYSNGTISNYEYALVLSRYGDTMVTLLAIEAVSGIAANQAAAMISSSATMSPKDLTTTPAKDPTTPSAKDAQPSAADPLTDDAHATSRDTVDRPQVPPAAGMMKVAERVVKPPVQKATVPPVASAPDAASDAKGDGLAAISNDAAKAVVMLQKTYLEQSRFAPFLVLCTAALSDPNMTTNIAHPELPSTIADVCSKHMDELLKVIFAGPPKAHTAN